MTDELIERMARAMCKRNYPSGTERDIDMMWEGWTEDAAYALAAHDEWMREQGMVMVPVEATARMAVAGANERENGDGELHARKWRAMIAAAQDLPK